MHDENEYAEHYEPQPPGMSTGTKVLLISLSVLGVLVVLCCGGVIYVVNKSFDWEMSADPAVVRQTQDEILELQTPARFEPKQSMKLKANLAGMEAKMQMAMFEARGAELSQLALMEIVSTMEEVNADQAEAQFKEQNPNSDQLENSTTETRTYSVEGKDITATFAHGTLKQADGVPPDQVGKEWYSVSSMITTPDGMVMFNMSGPEGEFDEEEVENMIKSIRLPQE